MTHDMPAQPANTTCRLCLDKPPVGICCSSHGKQLCHACYRRTHYVEVCVEGCSQCAAEGLPLIYTARTHLVAAPAAAGASEQSRLRRGVTTDPTDPRLSHGVDDQPVGQADAYLVLSEEQRAKGFIRPVRRSYWHTRCGAVTTMSREIAETYARDPKFYGATYCATCRMHRPVGPEGEFHWEVEPGRQSPMLDPKVGS